MPLRRSNIGRLTRHARAARRARAKALKRTEEEWASANERQRQIEAQMRAEESPERRVARLEAARLRARQYHSRQNERDILKITGRHQRETADHIKDKNPVYFMCGEENNPEPVEMSPITEKFKKEDPGNTYIQFLEKKNPENANRHTKEEDAENTDMLHSEEEELKLPEAVYIKQEIEFESEESSMEDTEEISSML